MGIERTWILLLLPIALALLFWKERSFLLFPSLDPVPDDYGSGIFSYTFRGARILLLLVLLFLSAGIRFSGGAQLRYGYGSDIVFLLDESRSMQDPFEPSRAMKTLGARPAEGPPKVVAAKKAIAQFMDKRKAQQDRYGLIAFGTSAIEVLPLSMNHDLFLSCLEAQEAVLSSTFIYNPIASGLNQLMNSRARSRVLVLVSDGGGPVNDDKYGFSGILQKYGIRFYWFSLGTDEALDDLIKFTKGLGPLGRRIDVSNAPELEQGFDEIHRLEKSLVLYKSSALKLSPGPMMYSALLLMTLTWISHSLFVYRRNKR